MALEDYSPEFNIVDSDDGLGKSPLAFLEFINEDVDAIQSYDAARGADHKGLLPPDPNAALNSSLNVASSPESPTDSSSASSSSKQTASSEATKTGGAGGDTTMTDGLDLDEWKVEDIVNTEDDQSAFAMDGTVDPLSIEGAFSLEGVADSQFEFMTPASTPSPFTFGAAEAVSPLIQTTAPSKLGMVSMVQKSSTTPAAKKVDRGHNKAMSQYSLTQSMNGLRTNGSREVSPSSNMVFSQDSSPSGAAFNNSPSPAAGPGYDFMNGMAPGNDIAMFPGAVGLHSSPHGLPAVPTHPNGAGQVFSPNGMHMGPAHYPPYQQQLFGGAPLYRLTINRTPVKSRVETQIPIKLQLSPLPPGIKRLHLPTHTISKPKLIAKPRPERSPDMLELSVMLVCTSAMQNVEFQRRALDRAAAAAFPTSVDARSSNDDDDPKPQDGGEVRICAGCITRERKRAARKKAKKPEEEENWTRDEHRRVVVFNTHEVKEWQDPNSHGPGQGPGPAPGAVVNAAGQMLAQGAIDAPMRIACYCRHHGEKGGFQVIFTIKDHMGNLVAQQFSDSIMITDDHKTSTLPPANLAMSNAGSAPLGADSSLVPGGMSSAPTPPEPPALSPGAAFDGSRPDAAALKRNASAAYPPQPLAAPQPSHGNSQSPGSTSHTPRNLSRPVSPNGTSGPSTKKRKSSGGVPRVPSGLAMTRLETPPPPSHSNQTGAGAPFAGQPNSAVSVSTATSPFSPIMNSFAVSPDSLFANANAVNGGAQHPQPFRAPQPTPGTGDRNLFSSGNRSASMDNLLMTQLYSAPVSGHPSRAPSPNSLRANGVNTMQQQSQFEQALANPNMFATMPVNMPQQQPSAPASVIHKIIPNEGPKSGGIEVTILGGGFYQGLEVMFGANVATTTTFWGPSSLVCLLPPSHITGAVLVTFKQNQQPLQCFTTPSKPQPVFKYVDDDEQQLMRTALSVLGHKMTGKIEDVRDVARRIIGSSGGGGVGDGGGSSSSGGGVAGSSWAAPGDINGLSLTGASLESQLLKVLELIDLDDSTHKARLNLQRRTGQTMLHLACSIGLHRFVAGLLARGANPDARDKGGYTPLHFAALNNHHEIVRRLIYAGADPTIRTLSGLTAADLSRSREVLKAIRRLERHTRSRSGGSLHSRASSATSLRSLWEPPSNRPVAKEYTSEESTSSGESPEYSENAASEDADDVAVDDDGQWLDMRRPSFHKAGASAGVAGTPSGSASSSNPVATSSSTPPNKLVPRSLGRKAQRPPPDLDDESSVAGSPSAAVAAFREQFTAQIQHLQQAMAVHLPNLPQFPYFSQMANFPGMPPLPDYQGYLNSAPMFQRISSLVPNIGNAGNGGSRPGSSSDNQQSSPNQQGVPRPHRSFPGKDWWDPSSLLASSAPPPAYEDIFPEKDSGVAGADLDVKQSSAARAAAEAEADGKCARFYDDTTEVAQHRASAVVASSSRTAECEAAEPERQKGLPTLLQIGRKNAITREQRDNLRRAHAEKYKGLRSDRNLYIIWIPILLAVLCATLYSHSQAAMPYLNRFLENLGAARQAETGVFKLAFGNAAANADPAGEAIMAAPLHA